jgi:hypothetical protein
VSPVVALTLKIHSPCVGDGTVPVGAGEVGGFWGAAGGKSHLGAFEDAIIMSRG